MRRALFRNLISELIRHERIQTTEAKARAIRGDAEKMITLAKRGDLHARRLVGRTISDPEVVKKLFDEVAPRYADRPGGYTRIVKLGPRQGDAAPQVLLELVK
jgi:large subunit ribosomal protein L17